MQEPLPEGPLMEALKSGVVLCRAANAIQSGICANPSESKMPFKQMENIGAYLKACEKLKVEKLAVEKLAVEKL